MYVTLQRKVYAKLWEKLLNLKAVKYTHLYASTRVTMVACGQGIGRWLGDNSQRHNLLNLSHLYLLYISKNIFELGPFATISPCESGFS